MPNANRNLAQKLVVEERRTREYFTGNVTENGLINAEIDTYYGARPPHHESGTLHRQRLGGVGGPRRRTTGEVTKLAVAGHPFYSPKRLQGHNGLLTILRLATAPMAGPVRDLDTSTTVTFSTGL